MHEISLRPIQILDDLDNLSGDYPQCLPNVCNITSTPSGDKAIATARASGDATYAGVAKVGDSTRLSSWAWERFFLLVRKRKGAVATVGAPPREPPPYVAYWRAV